MILYEDIIFPFLKICSLFSLQNWGVLDRKKTNYIYICIYMYQGVSDQLKVSSEPKVFENISLRQLITTQF